MEGDVIHVGAKVRVYHRSDFFDEGEVKTIEDGTVFVDFYDWIERFPLDGFSMIHPQGVEVFVPKDKGVVFTDFRRQ